MKKLQNMFGKVLDQAGIFKQAHQWTKQAFKDGRAEGSYQAWFAEYLRRAYAHNTSIKADYTEYKACQNRPEYIQDVPVWLLSKNLDRQEMQAMDTAYDRETVRETAKAMLVRFLTDYGNITCWVPKSVIKKVA